MRNTVSTAALLLVVCLGISCAGSQSTAPSLDAPDLAGELPAPNSISLRGASLLRPSLSGSDFEMDRLAPRLVTAGDTLGRFSPQGDPDPISAFALYDFELTDYSGPQTLTTVWQVPIMAEELWVGLGNRDVDAWDWFMLHPEGDLTAHVDEIGPYLDETDELLAVVLATGSQACFLSHLYFTESPPVIESVSPTGGASGGEQNFTAEISGLGPFLYAWDFGGGAVPNTSTEASPTVTLGDAGTYAASVTAGNLFGEDTYDFDLEVVIDFEPGMGHLVAIPAVTEAELGEPVEIVVASGDFIDSFLYMSSVAVTAELGAEYVDMSFNVGAPGGTAKDIDGIWLQVDPDGVLLPNDETHTETPVNGQPGVIFIEFSITPVEGSEIISGGELFNFQLRFIEPGTYTLGFLEFQDVKRTYYADSASTEYYWLDISNTGFPHSIVVSE